MIQWDSTQGVAVSQLWWSGSSSRRSYWWRVSTQGVCGGAQEELCVGVVATVGRTIGQYIVHRAAQGPTVVCRCGRHSRSYCWPVWCSWCVAGHTVDQYGIHGV